MASAIFYALICFGKLSQTLSQSSFWTEQAVACPTVTALRNWDGVSTACQLVISDASSVYSNHQFAARCSITMFAKIDPLPRSGLQSTVGNGNRKG